MNEAHFAPHIIISLEEVEQADTSRVLELLSRFAASPEIALANRENLEIAFHGFDDTNEELGEILEVRDFVRELDAEFPFWLFFLSKSGLGLQCVLYCFLLPHLTEAARAERHPQQLEQLLVNRWFPAMNAMSEFAGLDEPEIKDLTDRALRYFTEGPWNE